MNLQPDLSLEPPVLPTSDDGDDGDGPPQRGVSVCIHEIDGTHFSAQILLDGTAPMAYVASALVSCLTGAASLHSRMLSALLADLLSTSQAEQEAQRAGGLTVAALDNMARQYAQIHGVAPQRIELPGVPGGADWATVRATLVAAGCLG